MTEPRSLSRPATNSRPAVATAVAEAPVSLEHVAALLRGLNREQRRAVTQPSGPQLVLAGPGTGKTEVVTRRVAWLIATKRARPREILALTFTDKAASEMQARVDVLVPYGQADAAIHTFHAFGDRLLREHAFELGLAGDVRLLGRAELLVLLREHLFSLGLQRYLPLGDPTRFLSALLELFQRAKDEDVSVGDLQAHVEALRARAAELPMEERTALLDLADSRAELASAYGRYVALLGERGVIDHGDQVALALRLLRERPAVAKDLHSRYRYLLVDEFQDTNPTQLRLVMALTGPARNVTVVGDDDQAIYAFRGAAVTNMRRFVAAHPDLARVVLRRNYRSRGPIIAASQRLIRHNDGARLATLDGLLVEPVAHRRGRRSAPVRELVFMTADEEANSVAEMISRRVEGGERAGDFAILVRTNGEAEQFVRSLLVHGVPARSSLRGDLYQQPQVRSLLAFLRVVADPAAGMELYALATSEPYGLGGAELTALLREARRRHRSLWQVLVDTVDGSAQAVPLGADARRRVARLVGDVRDAVEASHVRSAGEVLYEHLRRSGMLARLARAGPGTAEAAAARSVARFFELVRAQAQLLGEDRVAFLVPHLASVAAATEEPADAGPDPDDAVSVLTVHRAKGLEFGVVFLCGLVDGRFPSRGRAATLALPDELRMDPVAAEEDPLAEERRLFYVAMTRARDEVWLSRSAEGAGGRVARRPSLFIAEAIDAVPSAPAGATDGAERIRAACRTAPAPTPPAQSSPNSGLSLSFSQIDDYLACPERYRLRHVVGVPTPPHHALAYGGALHQAVAAFHLSQAVGKPMGEDELLRAFARAWSPEGFLSRAHEEARYAYGQAALRRFREAQLANDVIVPVAVERPFSFSLGRDVVRGRIDRLDRTPAGAVITDYKSSDVREQAKADGKARESLQLQVYALAHQSVSDEPVAAVQLHFLDSGVVGRAVPSAARLERARQKLEDAAEGIRSGEFRPRPNAVACGYCPFRDICPSSAA